MVTQELARQTIKNMDFDELDRSFCRKIILDNKDKKAPRLTLQKNQLYIKRIERNNLK
jgi:hypothetical protein